MSILSRIGWGIWYGLERIGHSVLESLGLVRKSKAEKKAAANAELRRQWLALAPDQEKPEEGVEYEGEVYYETVK